MRSMVLALLTMLVPAVSQAESLRPGPAAVPAMRPARPERAGRVEIIDERADGVRLSWTAQRGDGRRTLRLALPPQANATLQVRPLEASDAGVPLPAAAARLGAPGFVRRLPFVDLLLDADALPAGSAHAHLLEVRFVRGAAPRGAPPAVLEDAEIFNSIARVPDVFAAAPVADEQDPGFELSSAEAVAEVAPSGELGAEPEILRLGDFANMSSARGFLAEALADGAARPPRLRRAEHGDLRRAVGAPVGRSAETLAGTSPNVGRLGAGTTRGFESGRVKIVVGPEDGGGRGGAGIYRVTGAELAALGVDLSSVPTADLRLVTHGFALTSADPREVALRVVDGGDGRLDAADFIEFWGEPVLGENVATGWQGLDYTDVNAYMLDAVPGSRLRMATRDAAPISPPSADYLETVHVERNDIFVGNHRTGEFNVDHYYWCGLPALEWQTGDAPVQRVETVPAEGVNTASARAAALRVRLLARSSAGHLSEVDLNGSLVSTKNGTGSYVEDHVATGLPAAGLVAAGNSVRIRLPGGVASPDRFELDWIELDYPRAFTARSGRLVFTHAPGASARVAGLGAAPPTILDLTNPLEPVLLTGAAAVGGDWAFELAAPGTTRYAAAGGSIPAPTALEWAADKGLSDPSLAVDVVLMGPRAWLEPPLPGIARWIADRESQGLTVLIAPTEDVIDEFNDGVFSPVALGWMLVDAFATWTRPPRYALLLGDATFDWKNDLDGRALQTSGATACQDLADPCLVNELAWCQHVPTRLFDAPGDTFLSYFASDVILAMVSGSDWVPDVALGRIPARTGAEAEALLDKVLEYEALRAAPPAWASRLANCADQMGAGEEAMEDTQDAAYAAHVAPTWQRQTYYYQSDYIDQGRGTRGAFRGDFLTRDWPSMTDGFAVASYVGHGNANRWSNAALLTNRNGLPPNCEDDARAVEASHVPGGPQPFMVNANCITASFIAQLGPGLLEEMVRQPNGGLIAGIGPTGITDLSHAEAIIDSFHGAVFGVDGRGWRAGDVLLAVQAELALDALFDATELLNTVLLGDPTLELVVPVGPPAGALRAVGGDSRVDLDWDAAIGGGAGVTYSVWRATSADGPWTRIASGLTGRTHADIAAPPATPDPQNGQRYWYAIEPVDAQGWPGRWSNHADARPCGPDVPAPPSNLNVSFGACASSITVTWTASPTSFLQGYRVRVYRGSSGGGILERSAQATGTFTAFSGLVPFATYTVTVAAVTWCGVESPAVERVVQLTCPAVLGPPEWVRDLRVRRAGTDLVLDWSPVTMTKRGDPLTPALYRVYRADRPDFLADAGRELPSVAVPGTTDPGRVFAGPSLEFYAVAAESAAGERGAVGHDFPQGVRQVVKTDAGADWQVSWTPTTHDMAGLFTPISGYLVYARTRAFVDRSDIAGLTPTRVAGPPALIPKTEGDFHLVVPEDVHGNQSVY